MEPAHILQTFAVIKIIRIKCMNEWVSCWWTYNPDVQDQIWNIIQLILTMLHQAMWQTVDREWQQCFPLTIFMRYICSSTCYLKLEMKVWSNLEYGWMDWTISASYHLLIWKLAMQGIYSWKKTLFDCSLSFGVGRGSKSTFHARVPLLHLS